MKQIVFLPLIFMVLILLPANAVDAVDCSEGQKYDSYWRKCQSLCNNYQEWDSINKKCISKIEVMDNSLLKGYITNYTGRVFIERGMDIITPSYNEPIYAGDTVVVDDGARAEIEFKNTKEKTIIEKKTKFKIPASEIAAKKTSKITLFLGGIWTKLKNLFGGEKFKTQTPTAVAGARG